MKLLTSDIKQRLTRAWNATAIDPDPVVHCKLFAPWGNWTWYAFSGSEMSDGDWLFFGYVIGYDDEFGNFSLSELRAIKGPCGLRVERDLHFKPCRLSEITGQSSFAA